jgi:outer membrane autotransporter protein
LTVVNDTATIQPDVGVYVKLPFWYQWMSGKPIFGSNTVYTILMSTNLIGQFNSNVVFNTSMLFLTPSLSYDPTNAYLDLQRKPFTSAAGTGNQNGVAGALDGIADSPGSPAMSNLVSEIFWMGSASEVQAALDSLSGEIHGTLGLLDVQQQAAFNNSIALRTGRMSAGGANGGSASSLKPVQLASAGSTPLPNKAEANQPLDIWLQGFGTFGDLKNDGNAIGGDFTIAGTSGGLDYRVCPEMLIGLGLGYSQNNADVGGPGANGRVNAFQVAGYGGYVKGPWHLDGILSYGYLHTDTKRFIDVGSIHQEADAKYNGGVLSLSAEGGYAFVLDWLTVEPTIGLNYSHLWQDSFSETGTASDGNNYGLNVNSVDMDSFRSTLGVRLAAQFGKKGGVQFIPALRAVWEHEFADRYADVNASFIGGSGSFDTRGVEMDADSGKFGAGLTVAFNKAIQGFVNYDASLNTQLRYQTVSGGLSLSW